MIDRQRMLNRFIGVVETDNSAGQEPLASRKIPRILAEAGMEVKEDRAGEHFSGNAGNLYGYIPGTLDRFTVLAEV